MEQMPPTRASPLPDVSASFKEVVLSSVRYNLQHRGVKTTRKQFDEQSKFYNTVDGWSQLSREVNDLIYNFMHASHTSVEVTLTDKAPINTIMKKFHDGRPIDFIKLHDLVEKEFVSKIEFGYEWLALWRWLNDMMLLETTTFTDFENQMKQWYPHAPKPCKADSMGDYSKPYLASKPHAVWTKQDFLKYKTNKQCLDGYYKLFNRCQHLKDTISQVPVLR